MLYVHREDYDRTSLHITMLYNVIQEYKRSSSPTFTLLSERKSTKYWTREWTTF